jgi:hypothetical protein
MIGCEILVARCSVNDSTVIKCMLYKPLDDSIGDHCIGTRKEEELPARSNCTNIAG